MSDVGDVIIQLLDSNVFTEDEGYSTVLRVFEYFGKGPSNILKKFDKLRDLDGNIIMSPLRQFEQLFNKHMSEFTEDRSRKIPLAVALSNFAQSNYELSYKLNAVDIFRKEYRGSSTYASELYNQLIDFVEDYIRQAHIIGQNKDIYQDLAKLAEGAEEMRILGQLLSLNQGIKTNIEDLLKQVNLIERAIYNKTGNLNDLVDLNRFVFDEDYRQQCINKYEEYKHSFNIYDVVSTVPHFMGYLQTLAITLKEIEGSYKFRSVRSLVLDLSDKLKYKKEDKITRGIQNFIGDYMIKQWMLSNDTTIVIPKGNKAFDKYGNMYDLTEDTPIKLGTDWGNATFRIFMENEVIPNLKKGLIKTDSNFSFVDLSQNRFIRDLSNDLLTTTVSGNPSIVYTLPINMLPRVDQERALFNGYKAEFNKLAKYGYQYQTTTYDENNVQKVEEQNIPIIDLFTYYAMIANSWKLGEKSLVPILEDFQNTGLIDNFHKFEATLDKSGEFLTLEDIDFEDIKPYVAPFESPYSSFANYIKYKNPKSRKYSLMSKLSNEELDSQDEDHPNPNIIKNYVFQNTSIDVNYFPTGRVESSTRTIKHIYSTNESGQVKRNILTVSYDIDSGKILRILNNGEKIDIPEDITTVPTVKQNGIKKVNVNLLESIVKNPC